MATDPTSLLLDQPAVPGLGGPPVEMDPITLRNLFMPWTQLLATGVPPERLRTSLDVQLALAMLVGQAGGVPKLVNVDAQGNLTVNTIPTPATRQDVRRLPLSGRLGSSLPAVGAQAIVTVPFDPPANAAITGIVAVLAQQAGAAITPSLSVKLNGVEQGPYIVGLQVAVGSMAALVMLGLDWLVNGPNATLDARWSGAFAGVQQSVAVYGFQF